MMVWLVVFYIEADSPQPFAYPYKVRVESPFSTPIWQIVQKAETQLRDNFPDAYVEKVGITDDSRY